MAEAKLEIFEGLNLLIECESDHNFSIYYQETAHPEERSAKLRINSHESKSELCEIVLDGVYVEDMTEAIKSLRNGLDYLLHRIERREK